MDAPLRPGRDPGSTKYPDRVFFHGHWRTPAQVEKRKKITAGVTGLSREENMRLVQAAQAEQRRARAVCPCHGEPWYSNPGNGIRQCHVLKNERNEGWNARRVMVGEIYVGMAPTPEHATALNDEAREALHDRKVASREEGIGAAEGATLLQALAGEDRLRGGRDQAEAG